MKRLIAPCLIFLPTYAFAIEFDIFGRSTGGVMQTSYQEAGQSSENYTRILPDSWFAQSFGFNFKNDKDIKGKIELTVYKSTDSSTSEPVLKNFYFKVPLGTGTLTIGTQPTLHTQVAYYHDVLVGGHDAFRTWVAGPGYNGSLNAISYVHPFDSLSLGLAVVEAKNPGDTDGSSSTDGDGNVSTTPKQSSSPALEAYLSYNKEVTGSVNITTKLAVHSEKMGIEDGSDSENLRKTENATVITGILGVSLGKAYVGGTYSSGDPIKYWFGRRMFAFSPTESNISIKKGLKDKYQAYAINVSYTISQLKLLLYNGKEIGDVDGAKKDIGETNGLQFQYPWQGIDWFASYVETKLERQEADYVDIATSTVGVDFKF